MNNSFDELYKEEMIELIEDSSNCKISEGRIYNIIVFTNKERSYIVYINKQDLTIEENNISENLANEIIYALKNPEDLGIEKLMAVMLIEDFYDEEM